MNSKFKEFWNEFTRNVDLDYVDPEEAAKVSWNSAIEECRMQLPDLGGYEYASHVRRQFHKNIDRLYV